MKQIRHLSFLVALGGMLLCGCNLQLVSSSAPASSVNPPASSTAPESSSQPASSVSSQAESSSEAKASSSSSAKTESSSSESKPSSSSEPKPSSSSESVISSQAETSSSSSAEQEGFQPMDDYLDKYNLSAQVCDYFDTDTIGNLLQQKFVLHEADTFNQEAVYEKILPEPSHDVATLDDFSDVLDYYAFYGDTTPFEVHLSDDFPNKDKEAIVGAFFNSKLCVSSVGLNRYYDEDTATFTVQLLVNPQMANYTPKWDDSKHVLHASFPYAFPSKVEKRANDFEDFPYLTTAQNGSLTVYNSEQLLYALEFGYIPVPIEDSPAEAALERAKEILRAIIYDDMTDFDKIAAIESYMTNEIVYDYTADEFATFTIDEDRIYPDYAASFCRSFYAEGGLFDSFCVCQGFAKTFNILATIEGIQAIKVSGRIGKENKGISAIDVTYDFGEITAVTYNSHGYSYVLNKVDGLYYICDVTYNGAGAVNLGGQRVAITRRYAGMMDYPNWAKVYKDVNDRFHLRDDVATSPIDFRSYLRMGTLTQMLQGEEAEIKSFLQQLAAYLSTYDDPNYIKHPDGYYVLNLTIAQMEGDLDDDQKEDLKYEMYSRFDNALRRVSADWTWWNFGLSYFSSDIGFLLVFKL